MQWKSSSVSGWIETSLFGHPRKEGEAQEVATLVMQGLHKHLAVKPTLGDNEAAVSTFSLQSTKNA